jgi:putative holliday junction resolvase
MARLMALDVGEARIGIAVSDATGVLASPYTTLRVSRDETQTYAAIQQLLQETEAEGLVIGLPVSLDGQLHAQGKKVQAFAERLKQHITIPITFWDERLSTIEAERLLAERAYGAEGKPSRQGGRRRTSAKRKAQKQPRQGIDALAAAVILQEYLDHSQIKDSNV